MIYINSWIHIVIDITMLNHLFLNKDIYIYIYIYNLTENSLFTNIKGIYCFFTPILE